VVIYHKKNSILTLKCKIRPYIKKFPLVCFYLGNECDTDNAPYSLHRLCKAGKETCCQKLIYKLISYTYATQTHCKIFNFLSSCHRGYISEAKYGLACSSVISMQLWANAQKSFNARTFHPRLGVLVFK